MERSDRIYDDEDDERDEDDSKITMMLKEFGTDLDNSFRNNIESSISCR